MNPRKRRLILALGLVALAALALAPAALASAGGGSAGFGGGGGGGGRGGGSGFALYILIQLLIRIALLGHGLGALVLIGLAVFYILFTRVMPRTRGFGSAQNSSGTKQRRRTAKRTRRVELAAAVAADEDEAFAPEAVKANATALFKQIQAGWDHGDRARLARLVAPDLMVEWDRRLSDLERRGWQNHVQILGEPAVEYVGLTHRGDQATDRVTVRIEAKLRDYVTDRFGNHLTRGGRLSETVNLREFWTLKRGAGGRWILASIEQGAEGAHVLDEEIVADAVSDERTLKDESLIEGAVADAVPEQTRIADLADLDFAGDARAAALDLSLADGRFAPDVLEVAARRAAAAWAEAVDGDDTRLRSIAHGQAVRDLLYGGDPSERTRLVVRGPEVRKIHVVKLDAAAQPPTMTIEVELYGRRYLEDRDTTAILAGSQARATTFTARWTFALDGDARQPWLLASAGAGSGSGEPGRAPLLGA